MGTAVQTHRALSPAQTRTLAPSTHPPATGLLYLTSDLIALLGGGWLGVQFWNTVNNSIGVEFYLSLWPGLGVFLLVYGALGLYPGVGISPVEELRRAVLGTTVVYLVSAASIFLTKGVGQYSRGVFLTTWFCSIFLVPLARALVRHLFATKTWWGVPVLVLGAGEMGSLIVDRLREQPGLGLKPVACLDDDDSKQGECAGVPVAGPLSMAPGLSRSLRIKHALVAMPEMKREQLIDTLERMGSIFSHLIVIPDLLGMASLWVTPRDLGGVLGLQARQNLLLQTNRHLKRGLDLVLGTAFGLIALPFIAAAVIWIKRVSPGSAFYVQEREGEGGQTIRVYKLRTMYFNADMMLLQYLAQDPNAEQEWQRYFKLKNDPRVLPGIGRILRRTSFDELPQLWNVLKGEMSLVGPRPFPYYHLDRFDKGFRALRGRVTPGLTGLWQVSARSNGDLKVQESLDTYYIRNWSLWLDVHILARTVRAVLSRQGAY